MSHAATLIPAQPAPPEAKTGRTSPRLLGYGLLTLWVLFTLALILMMVTNCDCEKFFKYGPRYLSGLWTTISLVTISFICGAILSIPAALARMSKNRFVSGLAYGYIYIFRGTPLLAQLFLIYYGLGAFRPQLEAVGLWWFFREA